MNNLNQYIQEKLKISSKSKISNIDYTTLDMHDVSMMIKVLKASFIGLYKQHFESRNIFKQHGLGNHIIRRRNVDYDNIYNILNDYYEYNFDLKNDSVKKSLQDLIKYYFDYLDKLINLKNVNIKIAGGDINAHNLYWLDWHNYIEKNPIK